MTDTVVSYDANVPNNKYYLVDMSQEEWRKVTKYIYSVTLPFTSTLLEFSLLLTTFIRYL